MPVTSRPAIPSDYDRFTVLFAELGTGDTAPDRERWQQAQMPATLFFEDAGEVVAYAWVTMLAEVGYVRHVVVDPAHRGRGVGRVVMDELAASVRRAGCSRWVLNVKPDNLPAVRLYRSVGMRKAYVSSALSFEWSLVGALPSPDRAVTARVVASAEDAALEDAFRLSRGLLASGRRYPDRVVLRLVDPAAPDDFRVGLASFDPHFPGSFPFKVAEPTLARPLLEAIRPHARPDLSHMGLTAEDDAALTQLLVDHGAVVRLKVEHYEGAL